MDGRTLLGTSKLQKNLSHLHKTYFPGTIKLWGRKISTKLYFFLFFLTSAVLACHVVCWPLAFCSCVPTLISSEVTMSRGVSLHTQSQAHHRIGSLFPWKPGHPATDATPLGKLCKLLAVHAWAGFLWCILSKWNNCDVAFTLFLFFQSCLWRNWCRAEDRSYKEYGMLKVEVKFFAEHALFSDVGPVQCFL